MTILNETPGPGSNHGTTKAKDIEKLADINTEDVESIMADITLIDEMDEKEIDVGQHDQAQPGLSKIRKWFYLFIVAMQGFLGPLSSSIYVCRVQAKTHPE
ncbi:unnamed protein product [Umbelopsis vinacea]